MPTVSVTAFFATLCCASSAAFIEDEVSMIQLKVPSSQKRTNQVGLCGWGIIFGDDSGETGSRKTQSVHTELRQICDQYYHESPQFCDTIIGLMLGSFDPNDVFAEANFPNLCPTLSNIILGTLDNDNDPSNNALLAMHKRAYATVGDSVRLEETTCTKCRLCNCASNGLQEICPPQVLREHPAWIQHNPQCTGQPCQTTSCQAPPSPPPPPAASSGDVRNDDGSGLPEEDPESTVSRSNTEY